jgi:hypothetical protein
VLEPRLRGWRIGSRPPERASWEEVTSQPTIDGTDC